jgi:hypothetical protein
MKLCDTVVATLMLKYTVLELNIFEGDCLNVCKKLPNTATILIYKMPPM